MPGGRPVGTEAPNRRHMRRLLEERFPGWHPVVQMAALAHDEDASIELRFQAMKEVAGYVVPKLRSIEHTGEGGGPLVITQAAGDDEL